MYLKDGWFRSLNCCVHEFEDFTSPFTFEGVKNKHD